MAISILLFSCSCDVISPTNEHFGYDSKLKKETWYNWDHSSKLEVIRYEYYGDGLLKHVSKTYDEINWEQDLFYNENKDIDKEIIYEGSYSIDTVNYKYNNKDLLILKETLHTTSSFSYRDTIVYKYNDSDMLIETIDKGGNQNTICKSLYEYDGKLLVKKEYFVDDLLLRTFKYEYDNGIKMKETIFLYDNIEYTYIYKYKNDLLIKIEGYFSNLQDIDSEEEFIYDKRNRLAIKRVKVSMISSYIDHVIYYEYF